MIAYKFLRPDGTGPFSRFAWPLPRDGAPGEWVAAEPDVCASGIHACRVGDLPYWMTGDLWEVELDGALLEEPRKIVAGRGRLVRRVDAWDAAARAAYGAACAERARERAERQPDLAGYARDAARNAEHPGTVGFIAARIAELEGGSKAYEAEREWQARWLADRLGLTS
jgi:hypothetical protein